MTGRVRSSLTILLIIVRYSKVLEQREELEQKHLHLLQILESERQAKWHYVQQTEELATSVKELRAEVLGRGTDVRNSKGGGANKMSETVRGRGRQDIRDRGRGRQDVRDRGRGRHDVRGRGRRGEWAGMMSKQGEGRYDIRERRGHT